MLNIKIFKKNIDNLRKRLRKVDFITDFSSKLLKSCEFFKIPIIDLSKKLIKNN